jgi:hypothetical protein
MSSEDENKYYAAQSLNFSFFSKIQGLSQTLPDIYKCYVETDASGSKNVYSLSPHFSEVHSVQLSSSMKKILVDEQIAEKVKYYSNTGSSLSALNAICGNVQYNTCFYLNYNNYNKDNDCLISDYVKKIVSKCKKDCIIIIDSFGLIDNCFSTMGNHTSELSDRIIKSCGTRLSRNYTVGSTSGGRYRFVLHLKKISE